MITAEVATPTIGIGAGPNATASAGLPRHVNLTLGSGKIRSPYGDAAADYARVQAFQADVNRTSILDDESYHLPRDQSCARDRTGAQAGNAPVGMASSKQGVIRPSRFSGGGRISRADRVARTTRQFVSRKCYASADRRALCREFSFSHLAWVRDVFSAFDHCLAAANGYRFHRAAELFLGWTMIGWIVALIWAVKTTFLDGALNMVR